VAGPCPKVEKRCDKLVDISKEIKQPSARPLAQFYKGHLLLTQARLLERDERNQEMSFAVGTLYKNASEAFKAVKDMSPDSLMSVDSQIRKCGTRSIYACAFVVSKWPEGEHLVGMTDSQYVSARKILRRLKNGELEKQIVTWDDQLSVP
jgi:hypothetical protein